MNTSSRLITIVALLVVLLVTPVHALESSDEQVQDGWIIRSELTLTNTHDTEIVRNVKVQIPLIEQKMNYGQVLKRNFSHEIDEIIKPEEVHKNHPRNFTLSLKYQSDDN